MRGVHGFALVVTVAVLATACSGDGEGAGPTPRPVSAECAAAFEEAVERATPAPASPTGSPTATPVSVPVGALFDLARTVPACRDAEEWVEAYRAHPLDATAGVAGITALRRICLSVPDEEVSESEPCREVTVGQPPGGAGSPTDGSS